MTTGRYEFGQMAAEAMEREDRLEGYRAESQVFRHNLLMLEALKKIAKWDDGHCGVIAETVIKQVEA